MPQFRFYVVEHGDSMMGVNLFDACGGSIQLAGAAVLNVPAQPSMSSVSLQEYPALLKGFGELTGFRHKPEIDKSVKPVQQKFWHPPLAMRDRIEAELKRMEADGIIEKIESSAWMSNLVVAKKKDGNIRLCVNLTDVNKPSFQRATHFRHWKN